MIRRAGAAAANVLLAVLGHEKHPRLHVDAEKSSAFEGLATRSIEGGNGRIDYDLPWPKYEFLQWLRANRPVVFHGSSRDDLSLLRTVRMTRDVGAFGDQQAVYASDDPVWAMYFAVLRRDPQRFRWTRNACLRPVGGPRDEQRLPRYSFAVNEEALGPSLLGPGTVYVLPREPFRSAPRELGVIDTCHLVSDVEVAPLAKLAVEPSDFPFADSIFTTKQGASELRLALARWRARLGR